MPAPIIPPMTSAVAVQMPKGRAGASLVLPLTGSEFRACPQPEGSGRHDVHVDARADAARRATRNFGTLVKGVGDKAFEREIAEFGSDRKVSRRRPLDASEQARRAVEFGGIGNLRGISLIVKRGDELPLANVGGRAALVRDERLEMRLGRRPQRKFIARAAADLELGRDGQARPCGGLDIVELTTRSDKSARKSRVVDRAQIVAGLGIGIGRRRRQRQAADGHEIQVSLDTADACIGPVLNLREAVLTKKRKLEILPVLLVDCAIQPQLAIEKRRLPAKFIICEIVGGIGANGGTTVDAAGAEAARPRAVDEDIA